MTNECKKLCTSVGQQIVTIIVGFETSSEHESYTISWGDQHDTCLTCLGCCWMLFIQASNLHKEEKEQMKWNGNCLGDYKAYNHNNI